MRDGNVGAIFEGLLSAIRLKHEKVSLVPRESSEIPRISPCSPRVKYKFHAHLLDNGNLIKQIMPCGLRKLWIASNNEVFHSVSCGVCLHYILERIDFLANCKLRHSRDFVGIHRDVAQ